MDNCIDEFVSLLNFAAMQNNCYVFHRDKAVAVTYPFKSGIWVTTRRAVYICFLTIIVLLLANLAFIKLSGIRMSKNHRKYCGLIDDLFIVDLLTASILPIGMYVFL